MASPPPLQPGEVLARHGGRTINHFTDRLGIASIAGGAVLRLAPGQAMVVQGAEFGYGTADFLADAIHDIFVTDIPIDATPLQLALIGVVGDRKEFVLSMGEQQLFEQGVRVRWTVPERRIGTIPGGTRVTGPFVVTRRATDADA